VPLSHRLTGRDDITFVYYAQCNSKQENKHLTPHWLTLKGDFRHRWKSNIFFYFVGLQKIRKICIVVCKD